MNQMNKQKISVIIPVFNEEESIAKVLRDIPEDFAHRGFKAFHYLMRWARPQYLIHGHVDTWDRRKVRETVFHHTTVLNINPYMVIDLE